MDKKLLQSLSAIVSKIPKKDLEENLEKAKSVLKTSNKEELEKMLSSPQISKLLGKDAKTLKEQLQEMDLTKINTEALEKRLK